MYVTHALLKPCPFLLGTLFRTAGNHTCREKSRKKMKNYGHQLWRVLMCSRRSLTVTDIWRLSPAEPSFILHQTGTFYTDSVLLSELLLCCFWWTSLITFIQQAGLLPPSPVWRMWDVVGHRQAESILELVEINHQTFSAGSQISTQCILRVCVYSPPQCLMSDHEAGMYLPDMYPAIKT